MQFSSWDTELNLWAKFEKNQNLNPKRNREVASQLIRHSTSSPGPSGSNGRIGYKALFIHNSANATQSLGDIKFYCSSENKLLLFTVKIGVKSVTDVSRG